MVLSIRALNQISLINHNLALRFMEIEEVHHIEESFTDFLFPTIHWINTRNSASEHQTQALLVKLQHQLMKLIQLSVVNPEERRILNDLRDDLEVIKELTSVLFKLSNTQHEHSNAMRYQIAISKQIKIARRRLTDWYEDETRQVNTLRVQAQQLTKTIKWTGAGLGALAVVLIIISAWISNTTLVQPILRIRETIQRITKGDLHVTVPVRTDDEIGELARCFNDMSESLHDLYQRLDRMAHTDNLTGLLNRTAFAEISEHEISAAKRHQRKFAIALLDLDKFKDINDKYGHIVGDAALMHVAQVCKTTLRTSDYIFRYGGEEFLLLLKENIQQDVLPAVERFRLALEHTSFQFNNIELNITASIGIALYPNAGTSIESLIHHADNALYQAKSQGRNRCVQVSNLKKAS